MSREDDICWYHGKLTRQEAETLLKEGKYFQLHRFIVITF